jgi:hypothetical protein
MEDEGSWPLVRGHPFVFYLEYLAVLLQPHLKERKEVSCIPHHHLPPNILLIKPYIWKYSKATFTDSPKLSISPLTSSFSARRL